ncbi:acyltransferase family protein [Novosphingobium album (ex Liu et al. 2023)]|uniref:Acyltransferase n=1 Tax=Novosphingobium album (ex Liu et al. 2023) TaxID=3031130 RepID=A0ABT5WTT4_9SPHN|nr:acyltransferase [Novosphingobium album (ex Liu et al. 2023)]MDE8653291.1 acyltransferase [Novosphingobium album (ex Liu et al. 2023)]
MDWLRIGAFGLLIIYHVGLVFAPWNFEPKDRAAYEWVTIPLVFTNSWRLSLLFAISGYASAALLARERVVGAFLRSRLARLGIPLAFGTALIVAPQPWAALAGEHGYPHGFGYFLIHDYFRFGRIDGVLVPDWAHLWFVGYLLVYTFVLGALWSLPPHLRSALRRGAERVLAGPWLLPAGMAFVLVARLLPPGWSDTRALVDDASAHAVYLSSFLFGVLLRRSEALRLAILRQWKIAGLLGLAGYLVVAGFEARFHGSVPRDLLAPFLIARAVQSWGMIVALFGIADRYWNRDGAWRATLAEAVFPFYIVHQTIIMLVNFWLADSAIGAPGRFAILIAATAGGCWLFYLVGREIGPLRPLIGLKRTHARAFPLHAPAEAVPAE